MNPIRMSLLKHRTYSLGHVCAALSLFVVACAQDAGLDTSSEVLDVPPVVETRWTTQTELFVEYPPLVEGVVSRFAIHFTDLATFEPVRAGRALVRLTGVTDAEFAVEAPGRPGIFGVDVIPPQAGRYGLELVLDAPGLADRHDLGEVTVRSATDAGSITVTEEPDSGSIPFLKEQQWSLDFATAAADQREMAQSLFIAAEIEPRTGGRVDVTAPVAGRLASDVAARSVGSRVARGEILAEIIPHSSHADDRPELELDVAEARDALELARAERARVDRLIAAGALPERRELEVKLAEHTAELRLAAADTHLAQLDATRTGESAGSRDIRFVLRAPMSGIVSESSATPGSSLVEGARLFQIVALDSVHVVGALPEATLTRLDELVGAELEVPGLSTTITLDRLVAIGRVLDLETRTVPIIYELRDPDRRLAIGQAVSMRVFVNTATQAVTVPETAIVDDAGQPVVFVQVGGESFERHAVQLGNRESGLVQITGSVQAGDRVVVRGAPFIRLAALSPQVPAHGHTH